MYIPDEHRYGRMRYRRAGSSGLQLPEISLGMWHNFGAEADDAVTAEIVRTAFDHGVTYFDLANNYGPPPGSAEERFGTILRSDFASHRDELVLATKAGYEMWPGPYGNWGSRKYILASCDQSLRRLGVDYVDIFYHHRPDPHTPIEETMGALASLVEQGKALYVAISNYPAADALRAMQILHSLGCPCILDQVRYSILDRWTERDHLLEALEGKAGLVCFSPLAQGFLTDRYLGGHIPPGSRASREAALGKKLTEGDLLSRLEGLNGIARRRGQSLSEMAIDWLLRNDGVSSVLVGASSPEQLLVNLRAAGQSHTFSSDELSAIDALSVSASFP